MLYVRHSDVKSTTLLIFLNDIPTACYGLPNLLGNG